jgi:hypothetical protein
MAGVGAGVRAKTSFTLVLPALLLSSLLLCGGCRRKSGPQPPDLTACTRLEVRDPCGTINYVFSNAMTHPGIFNDEEKELLRSSQTYAVTDPEVVHAFARTVAAGVYLRRATTSANRSAVTITCYRGDEHVTTLWTQSAYIRTQDANVFRYPDGSFNLSSLQSPVVEPLRLRLDCALHQSGLSTSSLLFRRNLIAYPDPNRWCDLTAKALWRLHGAQDTIEEDTATAALFRCPDVPQRAGDAQNRPASSWVSHYAMNPDCRPNSPGDVVLLFEAQAGWNQHGGPEVFTFDNHDPKGGCVLLNDGTIRFIRTKEELAQLRWKP